MDSVAVPNHCAQNKTASHLPVYEAELQGGCWPTPPQKLLLRAALEKEPKAIELWREWQSQTDVEHLDQGSSRLLPLLRSNLLALGVSPGELLRYASVGRHAWVKNQFLLAGGVQLVRQLKSAEIPSLLLKGAALIPLCYPDVASRPLGDFDLLVPTREAPRALDFLLDVGYFSEESPRLSRRVLHRTFQVRHAVTLENAQRFRFDLHRHVLGQRMSPEADREFWENAIPVCLGTESCQTLGFEDQLLHTIAHGARWCRVPPMRWLADAVLLLRAAPRFDWNRFLQTTHRFDLQPPVSQGLRVLVSLNLEPDLVPAWVLREVRHLPCSRATRREWHAFSLPPNQHTIPMKIWLRGRALARLSAHRPWPQRVAALPHDFMAGWTLESPRELLPKALERWHAYQQVRSQNRS